ncbi:MAG: helix-turn-helix domain-containing protein [Planctomycetes bacterium]|nr:helix-turn-helix domain-containing protein [Planctomycetota bacterium]
MPTKTSVRPASASYLKLVKAFPLRNLSTDAELDAALAVAHDLMGRELDAGGEEYLDLLADVIQRYEKARFPMAPAAEADLLRVLFEASGLTQTQLAKHVGIAQPTLSALLNGTRALAKEHIVALARHFGVSPAVFLSAPH